MIENLILYYGQLLIGNRGIIRLVDTREAAIVGFESGISGLVTVDSEYTW